MQTQFLGYIEFSRKTLEPITYIERKCKKKLNDIYNFNDSIHNPK